MAHFKNIVGNSFHCRIYFKLTYNWRPRQLIWLALKSNRAKVCANLTKELKL